MAKSDFCFNFYDGDAARDMAHMNRLERGAYMDVLIQQRQRGHMTVDDLKKFLSKDFDAVWGALEWVMKKDAEEKFFIEWIEISEARAKTHSKLQKERRSGKSGKPKQQSGKPKRKSGRPPVEPVGNGNGYEDGIKEKKGVDDFELLADYEQWTNQAADGNDPLFQPMYQNAGLRLDPARYVDLCHDHFGLLCRYPKMRPQSQHAFRVSLLKHLRENANGKVNGTTGKKSGVAAVAASIAERYGSKNTEPNP